jgi:hypothetical protein
MSYSWQSLTPPYHNTSTSESKRFCLEFMKYLDCVGDNDSVNLCWFVTLTLWYFITPKQCLDWFTTARECDFFEFSLSQLVPVVES